MSTLAEAAVAYARAGYAVFPLAPGTKVPRVKHGHLEATTDVDEVRQHWDAYPDSNIGLRPAESQYVPDVDSAEGHDADGHATLAGLIEELGPLPDDCPIAETPTGGLHIWLSFDGGPVFGSLGPGVEVKSHSGYVVAPPSIIDAREYRRKREPVPQWAKEGREYRWRTAPNGPPPRSPDTWCEAVRKVEPPPRPKTKWDRAFDVVNEPWVRAGVEDELKLLANTSRSGSPPGGRPRRRPGRQNWLNDSAVRCARLLLNVEPRPGRQREALRQQLIDACHANGLVADDGIRSIEKTIDKSAFPKADRDGPAPRPTPNTDGGNMTRRESAQAAGEERRDGNCGGAAEFDATFFDKKHGLRALNLANAVMRSVTCGFNHLSQQFYVYNDGVWQRNQSSIEAEIARLLGNRYRTAHARNVLDLIRLSPDTLSIDCDPKTPQYINVRNGMLNWKTRVVVPHSPEFLSTVQLPIEYDPAAQCPEFDKFLSQVLPPDCIEFAWEIIGYAMYSGNPFHVAVLLRGKGRNGKGTLIRVLKALLGVSNCSSVGLHDLTDNRFRAATLHGKLANLAGDLDAKWIANTAAFKAITGGDTIQAEHKYGAAFDFTPWALPVYSANKAFGSSDSSEGWLSRWIVVPFPNDFSDKENRDLDNVLQADGELRGVMRKGVEALSELMKRGRFTQPESVREAKDEFVTASDAVRAFLNEQCSSDDPDAWQQRKELYDRYRLATFVDGSKTLSAREFYQRVAQVKGIVATTRDGYRGFKGVRLLPPDQESAGLRAGRSEAGTPWWGE